MSKKKYMKKAYKVEKTKASKTRAEPDSNTNCKHCDKILKTASSKNCHINDVHRSVLKVNF